MKPPASGSIDEYIAGYPPSMQKLLKQMRGTIRQAVPEAEEKISYGMPSFRLGGRYLVYYGAFKNHVSLFPASSAATQAFSKELAPYKASKGTIRFPLDKPLPLALISKIAKYRADENLSKVK